MHNDRERSQTRRPTPEDTMTTNRPFFSNFLSAFRAQSAIQKAATAQATTSSGYAHAQAAPSQSTSTTTANTSRTISTKAGPTSNGATTTAVQAAGQFQPTRQHTAPYHRSTSPTAKAFPIPGASRRDRRGSDSSNEGFHEAIGAEKWYIGGRTAAGEEKFYRLGMVKRHRSVDRLSLDRLSI
ncbi:hypothetical protein BU24DRAFT_422867 [Aaosphaeria arxii CBS 175.79]|uniref:Uncharacterized protein n=1 Tax=Aaosphaeria arxii CBS 175.79 TaxID=1450172 RepID=A0A6A5XUM2_9PLEO|nr:uncharacterized protein BU24DRAFT_422867 [Aaosphaeria arxii CBS 175.79]KAF2016517.1 hypothetical protein BU24DRAFT_422867 [Aaosphaeria arxii CBS 175.79]